MCHVSLPPKARRTLGETRYIAANFSFRVFGPLAVFTVTARSVGWRWLFRLQFSLKCLPKFVTGPSSPRQWKQLVPHQVRCMSAPKHWHKASSTPCPPAPLKLHTAFLQPESSPTDQQPCHISRAVLLYVSLMTNHHLSVEQRFHLEAAFREIDGCEDIEKLRALTKQIITAQENEKAFAREAMQQIRKELEASAQQRFGFNWGQK